MTLYYDAISIPSFAIRLNEFIEEANGGYSIDKMFIDISKVSFDFEDVYTGEPDDLIALRCPKLFGFQTLGSLNFYGMWSGGNWEFPVYFILYPYNRKILAYIPEDGNRYNTKTMEAYGNDEESDEKELALLGFSMSRLEEIIYDQDKILADIQRNLKEKV